MKITRIVTKECHNCLDDKSSKLEVLLDGQPVINSALTNRRRFSSGKIGYLYITRYGHIGLKPVNVTVVITEIPEAKK